MAFLITGRPGVGKTTLVLRTMELLGQQYPDLQMEGFVTEEVRGTGGRLGFDIINVRTKQSVPLARLTKPGGPKMPQVGRYSVYLQDFEQTAIPILKSAQQSDAGDASGGPKLIFVDEIGKMELYSSAFVAEMRGLLSSGAVVVATIAEKGGGFIAEAKSLPNVQLITVTNANRNALPNELAKQVSERVFGTSASPSNPQSEKVVDIPEPAVSNPADQARKRPRVSTMRTTNERPTDTPKVTKPSKKKGGSQ